MSTLGLEMSDDGFLAAIGDRQSSELLELGGPGEIFWPAFVLRQGRNYIFGAPAENEALVYPRQTCSTFWEELSRHPSDIGGVKGVPACSELAYFFLRSVLDRVRECGADFDKVHLAVPGHYLDPMYGRDEKIGLVLGMARDLGLPLTGIGDLSCLSLYNTSYAQVSPSFPVVLLDLHLHAAHLSVLKRTSGAFVRMKFMRIPALGFLEILDRLMAALANRFLRETAFDISADRRVEQAFYQKLKNILTSRERVQEAVVQIQTPQRSRQLKITRESLRADSLPFVETFFQAVERLVKEAGVTPAHCSLVLTERMARVRGLEVYLREHGFQRICKLDVGEAARSAVNYGSGLPVVHELEETPVSLSISLEGHADDENQYVHEPVLLRAVRILANRHLIPTHFVLEGQAFRLPANEEFTVGTRINGQPPEVEIPQETPLAGDFWCRLKRRDGVLMLECESAGENGNGSRGLIRIDSGDRLRFGQEPNTAEILFIHCGTS